MAEYALLVRHADVRFQVQNNTFIYLEFEWNLWYMVVYGFLVATRVCVIYMILN